MNLEQVRNERAVLSTSQIACALSDAWAIAARVTMLRLLMSDRAPKLMEFLDAIELATRESPLREARP